MNPEDNPLLNCAFPDHIYVISVCGGALGELIEIALPG